MKWQGRRGSDNIEDRRGMSSGTKLAGGGAATLIIILVVYLLGGDPSALLDQSGISGAGEPVEATEAENDMAQFVSVVLADTEEVWDKIFREQGAVYRQPRLVLFRDEVQSA